MDRFVHDQNLIRFVDALEHESNPARRDLLQQLLLEEENRFGGRREKLEQANVQILRGRERVRRQRELVARLTSDGANLEPAQQVLMNMLLTQSLFEAYRDILLRSDEPPSDRSPGVA